MRDRHLVVIGGGLAGLSAGCYALRSGFKTHWKLFDPIVLASFGVAAPYANAPSLLTIDGIQPFDVGGRTIDTLSVPRAALATGRRKTRSRTRRSRRSNRISPRCGRRFE